MEDKKRSFAEFSITTPLSKTNKILVSYTKDATSNTVFFPGDVQNFEKDMTQGEYKMFAQFSYEGTAKTLAEKFPLANIWIIKPNKIDQSGYSYYDNFVNCEELGAVSKYLRNGHAVEHLASILDIGCSRLSTKSSHHFSSELPIALIGFSKGVIVLNQLLTELGQLRSLSPTSVEELNIEGVSISNNSGRKFKRSREISNHPAFIFFKRVYTIHWLDGGNGSLAGVFPLQKQDVLNLSTIKAIKLFIHVTPFQFSSSRRPWISEETNLFISQAKELDCQIFFFRYFENEMRSFEQHFRLLNYFHAR